MPDEPPADRNERVAAIQVMLAQAGLYTGDLDGKMGPGMRAAIRNYERRVGLPETGQPSTDVFLALKLLGRGPGTAPPAAPTPAPAAATGAEPWPAARHQQIGRTQLFLQQLGYYDGGIDSELGRGTRAAIARFQADAGLPETGEPSPETWDAIQRRRTERVRR